MEKEENNQQKPSTKPQEPELVLQWGKRLRCVRFKNPNFSGKSSGGFRRKITSRIVSDTSSDPSFSPFNRLPRGSEYSGKSDSPEKEERYYTTRGTVVAGEDSGRLNMEVNGGCCGGVGSGGGGGGGEEKGKMVLPKLYISLSSKEKEEDFLAMKGCKLPQRPKKRAKLIQRTLLLVSPGAWLSDMCQERYEVREKKTPKKRPRGLKAMGNMGSDSE